MLSKIVKGDMEREVTRDEAENILKELREEYPIGHYYIQTESIPHKWKGFEEYYDYVEISIIRRYKKGGLSEARPKKIAEIKLNRWEKTIYFESLDEKILPYRELSRLINGSES